MKKPTFHMLCAGTTVAAYAQLALRCLIASCPEHERRDLRICLHLVGFLEGSLKVRLRQLFESIPGVEVVEDTIRIDEHRTAFDRFRCRWVPNRVRKFLHQKGQGYRMFRTVGRMIAGPRSRDYLGMYYHEWITAVCELNQDEEGLVIIDSDLFVLDERLFQPNLLQLAGNEFGGGWVWRYPDWVRCDRGAFRPIGTELCLLNPIIFSQTNCQTHTFDLTTLEEIRKEFPDAEFAIAQFIDSIYGPSWLAQLKGFKADIRFKDLKICHPGGVGHFNPDYLKNVPSHEIKDEWIDLNIRRVRMHDRIQRIIQSLNFEYLVDTALFDKIGIVREYILSSPELALKWRTLKRKPDEEVLDEIASFASGRTL